MILIARTASLLLGAALLGLIANAVRPDGMSLLAWAPTTVCESAGEIAELPPPEAQDLCRDPNTVVIDVRSAEEFALGHIPEALHLPCKGARLDERTFNELSNAASILVYGRSTADALAVAETLAQRNLPVRVLAGGYPEWEAAGLACSSGPCADCLGQLHDHGL